MTSAEQNDSVRADDAKKLIANTPSSGENLLSVMKGELASCDSFDFCVAFVAEGGVACLVDVLAELKSRNVPGRLLTSTYLTFNSPSVFRKLMEYDNIEVRVFQGNLHAKGYVFSDGDANTVIVGSSNLTQAALTCNKEWNILFRSAPQSEMVREVQREYELLWNDPCAVKLSEPWIARYEELYKRSKAEKRQANAASIRDLENALPLRGERIKPNKMQELALKALGTLHERKEPRALLVSATGTGKTYLSAFDVMSYNPKRVLFLAHRKRILSASMQSYKKLLGDHYSYEIFEAGSACNATCVFAMCSTIVRHLSDLDPKAFDYIIVDEAHRTGSASYRTIMDYFEPKFYLGMTATPNRTDGYDVFEMFNHVIAYQITLQDALANDMLVPFHYYGIADLKIDYEEQDDLSLFSKLTSEDRVRHIVQKIEEYVVDKSNRRGLIFCNRNEEASELSRKFNELGYKTVALSGANTDQERDEAIAKLESGELEYIFSVDIFNEGIDIPSVNQIIMLRKTESAIVFVQQLGRGLRKDGDKEYALVLDFIGNYQKNYFVPVALSGDKTFNKDNLRTIVKRGSTVIPGASTVSFDKISEAQIYRAIDGGSFTSAKFLKGEYQDLRRMLGRIPALSDFDRNNAIDPLLIFKKYGSYHAFLSKVEPDYKTKFDERQESVLKFLSQKIANGKRFEDLFLLKRLIEHRDEAAEELLDEIHRERGRVARAEILWSATSVLHGDFFSMDNFVPLVMKEEGRCKLMKPFARMLEDDEFARQVIEVLDFGIARSRRSYCETYKDTSFVLNAKYTYEEVCRLLGWAKNINGQNLGGYFYDEKTNTFPVFINYDKSPSISDSIKYEDRFIGDDTLIAISKNGRSLASPEIRRLQQWPNNGMTTYLFMRKNKDDETSKEFYFFGEMYPTGEYKAITMPSSGTKAVEITYRLETPIRKDLFEFMTSDLSE